jgi:hypothetical protein
MAGDDFALTPAAPDAWPALSPLSACCNAASETMVTAMVAIGAFVFRQ